MRTGLLLVAAFISGAFAGGKVPTGQTPAGRVFQSPGGATLRVLLDQPSLGGAELEVGELTFPPNSDSGDHKHGVTEAFYVVEGELEHVVNGRSVKLTPGMAGSVRPPDSVRHKTGSAGAKAVVIWVPGGEVARVTARWRKQ